MRCTCRAKLLALQWWIPSSTVFIRMTGRIGPKGSSQAIRMSGRTWSIRIGHIKLPSLLHSCNKIKFPPSNVGFSIYNKNEQLLLLIVVLYKSKTFYRIGFNNPMVWLRHFGSILSSFGPGRNEFLVDLNNFPCDVSQVELWSWSKRFLGGLFLFLNNFLCDVSQVDLCQYLTQKKAY